MNDPVLCAHCPSVEAELVTGREIYPHRPDLYHKKFWRCPACEARVGCHPGTNEPLGHPSNAELRYGFVNKQTPAPEKAEAKAELTTCLKFISAKDISDLEIPL